MAKKMVVTYTNWKGVMYFLCRGVTKTGKPRYYFSKEIKGEPLERVPDGYEITESVNGIVSLSKIRPKLISDREAEIVKSALTKNPSHDKYIIEIKSKEIIIYEKENTEFLALEKTLSTAFDLPDSIANEFAQKMKEEYKIYPHYSPLMKFILNDEANRLFHAQRMCFLGNINDWIDIEFGKPIDQLTDKLIPTLGTDEFYELY